MTENAIMLAVKPNPKVAVSVVHEDGDLLIVDKAAGVVTQPGKGHASDSLLNGVFALRGGAMGKILHNLGVRRDFGLLHRLDKETSGLLVVAKTPNAYDQLRRDFEARRVDKEYLAITEGVPSPRQGVVQARLKEAVVPNAEEERGGRGGRGREGYGTIKKVVISRQGQEAISAYRVVAESEKFGAALVEVKIKTGRLHQIRAHMMFLACRVFGDALYVPAGAGGIKKEAKDLPGVPRLCLHAFRLGFKHPAGGDGGKWVHYQSPLPRDLAVFAGKLGLAVPEFAAGAVSG